MANTIQLKRSNTTGAVPTTTDLELGELAINTFDGKIYLKRDNGVVEEVIEITAGGGATDAADRSYSTTMSIIMGGF